MMKLANMLLTVLIALCSFGCAVNGREYLPRPPAILNLPECQEPNSPDLIPVDGDLPFDAPENIKALLERDDEFRLYYHASQQTFSCYRRVLGKGEPDHVY